MALIKQKYYPWYPNKGTDNLLCKYCHVPVDNCGLINLIYPFGKIFPFWDHSWIVVSLRGLELYENDILMARYKRKMATVEYYFEELAYLRLNDCDGDIDRSIGHLVYSSLRPRSERKIATRENLYTHHIEIKL